ncbi:ATP-binding cassette domain-containing protein [Paenibacillus sp. LS1]|uniref:ABC transporter ATP-binding protein n=1 Tax=Paenibacillus sp. LS1 TaxID=2992120 RepID=UPI002230BB24|nr:ATP-binding cassette domain-containing protein [Paenibacillus sp. LS1]MCW3795210.1 ATP-binding cassette domain-containing protein [Paenibacillus sp. LS1]
MSTLVAIDRLVKRIGITEQHILFEHVNAAIDKGERIAILGASGQGKSTLLRILSLLDVPDEGDMLWKGTSYRDLDPRTWRMRMTYVAQQAIMLAGSVEDNLKTVHLLHRKPYDQDLARRLLAGMGLENLDLHKRAGDLSGGEKQRISLIRSMMLRPEVLLLDEVTASLDRTNARLVEEQLTHWSQQEGTSLVWVTHDQEQARSFSTTTWFMGNQTLLERKPTASFFNRPDTDLARQFIMQPAPSAE